MKVFAIGDLHLPGGQDKPMDIFGSHWENHWKRIKKNWADLVRPKDIVLIPGDISWAMTLKEALSDLEEIGGLPGTKVMIKGNHDYWWSSVSRIRAQIHESMYVIQNDSLKFGKFPRIAFCGTRGWTAPGGREFTQQDQKIFDREILRLKLSLDSVKDADEIIVLLHFPPFTDRGGECQINNLLEQYPVSHVVFGHIHGEGLKAVTEGDIGDITYHLVSCDHLNFSPKLITEF